MKANVQIQVEALIEDVQTAKTYITNYVTGNKLEASFYRYCIINFMKPLHQGNFPQLDTYANECCCSGLTLTVYISAKTFSKWKYFTRN